MKYTFLKSIALAGIIAFTASCKNENEVEATEEKETAEATAEAVTYNVNTDESKIMWVGTKPTGEHNGHVKISDGMVKVKNDSLQAGEFTIDMTTINVEDLEGEAKQKLAGHLKSGDFFDVSNHPKAMFKVTGISKENGETMLSGNLTMRGKTKNISFPVMVNYEGDKMMLESKDFDIDRTDWDITYKSASLESVAKDAAISDDMNLQVKLVANKA
jgi:polyisoprenoid-binding protein YceI